MPHSLESDFTLLLDAVRGAGAISLHYFSRKVQVWEKSVNDPVSEADFAVNRYLKARLEAARPDYGWLSEENEDDPRRLSCERVWVVDPIDGTRAFLRGTHDFAISAALVESGRPVLGAVYCPLREEMFAARLGFGATLNGAPITVGTRSSLDDIRMAGDESYFTSAKLWPLPWPGMRFHRCNSIALRLCFVSADRNDAAVTLKPKNDWDIAAAELILSEAGGIIISGEAGCHLYNSRTPKLPMVAATSPALVDAVMERVAAARSSADAQKK